jgi:hypothetical protein
LLLAAVVEVETPLETQVPLAAAVVAQVAGLFAHQMQMGLAQSPLGLAAHLVETTVKVEVQAAPLQYHSPAAP